MRKFAVTVCTLTTRYRFDAIGTDSASVHAAALERFGGLCSAVVIPR